MDNNALNIYTDGSSYSKPKAGGIGIEYIFPDYLNLQPTSVCPVGYKEATNNEMELKACIVALDESLKFKKEWQRIVIHTDSSYVADFYKTAMYTWSKNGWKKIGGAPVSNAELWKALLKSMLKTRCQVDIEWVKGHAKNEHNKNVDRLAKASAKKAVKEPLKNIIVRRKKSPNQVEIGCVLMLGQKIKIRTITEQCLKLQNIKKYKYEVISENNPFYQCVDFIYCKEFLRAGHEFYVKFNKDQNFPQVVKIYRDITLEKRKKVVDANN